MERHIRTRKADAKIAMAPPSECFARARYRRVITQRHRTRIVFPQELRALVELASGWELCGWFSNFSLRRPLEKTAQAQVMITALRAR